MASFITTVPANLQTNVGIFTNGDIPGVGPALSFPHVTNIGGFTVTATTTVTSISFPNCTSIDPTTLQDGGIFLLNNAGVTTISAPVLTKTGGGIFIEGHTLLTSINLGVLQQTGLDLVILNDSTGFTGINLPALTFCGGDFAVGGAHFNYSNLNAPILARAGQVELSGSGVFSLPSLAQVSAGFGGGNGSINSSGNFTGTAISLPVLRDVGGNILLNCPNVVTIDLSSYVPINGVVFSTFGSNNVNAATNNAILHQMVLAAGFTSGSVVLAGAAPTGQGLTDKATLIGRGISVTTS